MNCPKWVGRAFALALASLLVGCGGSKDFSTPKATMKTFVDAMRRGDAAKAKECVTNGDTAVIDVMVPVISGMSALQDAAVSKFGDAGKAITENGGMPDFSKVYDDADVKENGDTATVTPKSGGGAQTATLKKVNGDWKLDLAQGGMPSKAEIDQMGPMFKGMADATKEVAGDITAGKYKSVDEAKQALNQKMMASAMSGMAKPPGGTPQ